MQSVFLPEYIQKSNFFVTIPAQSAGDLIQCGIRSRPLVLAFNVVTLVYLFPKKYWSCYRQLRWSLFP